MAKAMSKANVITELASVAQLDKKQVINLLQALKDLAYREAHNGFTIPGLCKIKVVTKKPTQCRNPTTGQLMQIGARDTLKIIPLKTARDRITPRPQDLVTIIEEPVAPAALSSDKPPVASTSTVPKPEIPAVPEAAPVGGQILFECEQCKSTLSAMPSEAGMSGVCPYCDHAIQVPEQRLPLGTKQDSATTEAAGDKPASGTSHEFVLTRCRTCGQEIEAPSEMAGMEVNCPSCSTPLQVPALSESMQPENTGKQTVDSRATDDSDVDMSSMTIRIDLSDLE